MERVGALRTEQEWLDITRHPEQAPQNAMEASALRRVVQIDERTEPGEP